MPGVDTAPENAPAAANGDQIWQYCSPFTVSVESTGRFGALELVAKLRVTDKGKEVTGASWQQAIPA
jgi:hypothetical protein